MGPLPNCRDGSFFMLLMLSILQNILQNVLQNILQNIPQAVDALQFMEAPHAHAPPAGSHRRLFRVCRPPRLHLLHHQHKPAAEAEVRGLVVSSK